MLKLQRDEILNPYILTLSIDEKMAAFFNRQRQLYFPESVNYLQAHLTLFHYLPLPAPEIIAQLKPIVTEQQPFAVDVVKVVSLGKGVAYQLKSTELQQLHSRLQQLWKPLLKPQDTQKLWPHITIQNKVTPQQAKELLAQLQKEFQPFSFIAQGLSLWEYLGGPWQFVETILFAAAIHP